MDIKTSFKLSIFIPLVVLVALNAFCFVILSCLFVFTKIMFSASMLYLLLFSLVNTIFLLCVILYSKRLLLNNITNGIRAFYDDMVDFYKNNHNGFHSWAQRVIRTPLEVAELSKYFHNNIARVMCDLNVKLDQDTLTNLRTGIRLNLDLINNPNHVMAVLNISNFKEINSFYGIKVADDILKSVAQLLKQYFANEHYLLYRIHGDDFAIVWPNCTDRSIFITKLEKLLEFIEDKDISIDGYTYLNINITIGVSSSYDNSRYSMVNALMALHHAKEYKNPIVIYNKNLPLLNTLKNNIKYTEVVYHAIKNNSITPFYQQIASIQGDDKMIKYEALMRIVDKDGYIVPPNLFLELSKRSNAYSKLSRIMIENAFKELSIRKNCIFSVNLALEDMNSQDFCMWFMDRISHYELEDRVVVEITEQESVEDFDSVSNFIANVKELGVKIALDDFGSGYSNFAILIKLQMDFLKIDGSLIKNIDKDINAQLIVETIIRFAKLMKIKTIAEFVSSDTIYNIVKNMGVDYAQGYFIGKPVKDL